MLVRRALLTLTLLVGIAAPVARAQEAAGAPLRLPYAEAGLTAREAAAHLLDRLGYGPRPGEVERVATMGPAVWVEQQLAAAAPEPALARHLASVEALAWTGPEQANRHPHPNLLLRMAVAEGYLDAEAPRRLSEAALRDTLRRYAAAEGYRPQDALLDDAVTQAVLRARYAENQLAEVLTRFWRNHFAVSYRDPAARPYVLGYERDALRPHVLGDVRTLLGAAARHPALLSYLDNPASRAPRGTPTTLHARLEAEAAAGGPRARRARRARNRLDARRAPAAHALGINENFARELLELHTLGVDGGYTQADVEAVARVFTGWSVRPRRQDADALAAKARTRAAHGFVYDPATDFYFRPFAHDAAPKTALGLAFPAGGGLDEGERLLDHLAAHPATARHLSRKLAAHFVADDPPAAVVDALAATFAATGGDLRAVMRALVEHPAFWTEAARMGKVKDPFAYAVSALRALDAEVTDVRRLDFALREMGLRLYRPAAPTGHPDAAAHWLSAGTLTQRLSFAFALTRGDIDGVCVRLDAPFADLPPDASSAALLAAAAPRLLPADADPAATVARLRPALRDALPDTSAAARRAHIAGLLLAAPAFQQR